MDNNKLNNEELEKVTGGYGVTSVTYARKEDVVFKWNVGERVEKVTAYAFLHVFTCGCTIIDRKVDNKPKTNGYCAWYKVSSSDNDYNNNWYTEDSFEHGYESIFPNIIM